MPITNSLLNRLKRARSYVTPRNIIKRNYFKVFQQNDIQICYNKEIINSYDKDKKNILIAIESPALIEHNKWLHPDMEFVAEISFKNFYNLDNYYCPKKLYSTNDNFVNMQEWQTINKTKFASLIYSHKTILPGHKLRHNIAQDNQGLITLMGSGTGAYLKRKSDSLIPYKYQVVIENCKHPNYVSEKFFDCLKTQTIPIYWGGEETIKELGFDTKSIIFFNTVEELLSILEKIKNTSFYEDNITSVQFNYELLKKIRKEQSIFAFLQAVGLNYFHTEESYTNFTGGNLNFDI